QLQISEDILTKWQKLINLLGSTFTIPSTLICLLNGEEINLIAKNQITNNSTVDCENINKLYSKKVIESGKKVLVACEKLDGKALKNYNENAQHIAYLGYPIFLPNGNVFGSICVLNRNKNSFTKEVENLLTHIKEIIELDLAAHISFYAKSHCLEQKIREQIKSIEKSKEKDTEIRNKLKKEQSNTIELNSKIKELNKNLYISEVTTNTLITKMNSATALFSGIWDNKGQLHDAKFIDMNPANETMIGWKKEDILGKTIREIFPNTEQEWFHCFELIFTKGTPMKFELTHKGLGKHFLVNAFQLGYNSFCVLYSEKSKSLSQETKVKKVENPYRSFFEGINISIVVFNPIYNSDGKIINLIYSDMNPANEHIMNFQLGEVKGKSMLELFPQTKSDFFHHFNQAKEENRPVAFELYINSLDKYFSSSVFTLQDQFVFTCYDISERIKANKQQIESEQIHRAIFDNNGSIMMLIDSSDGSIVNANEAALTYTGYDKKSLLQMKIVDINKFDKETIQQQFEFLRANKKVHLEFQHRISSGEIKNIEVFASPIKLNNRKLQHIIINDTTEKKRDHRDVLKLSKALEQAPVSIVITDVNGLIEYTNPYSRSLTGYKLNELLGKNARIMKSGEVPHKNYEQLWKNITSGQNWEGEFYNRKKNGTHYWENATVAPITDENGQIISFIKVGQDITKQKELQHELRTAKLKAEESDRLKTAFLANLSHEIRTPLNGIMGFTDLLMNSDCDHDTKQTYGTIIQESGEQLMMIVSDLVKIAQIEAKQLSIRISSFSINKFLNEIALFYEPEILKKNLGFTISMGPYMAENIRSDRKRIRQILDNLIRNAIKFTNKGSIHLKVKYKNDCLTFSVSDTGIGISKEYQKMIFDRFRQIEENPTRNFGGNGLGLSISKEITELMGGNLWVESEPGEGSRFTFTIPLNNVDKFKELKQK
uniref:PAS domain S-box protein n=1 Tax=Labilibaculum sp. TaxID=2060723 RepID=UPI0035679F9F